MGYDRVFSSLNLSSAAKGSYDFRAFSPEISLLLVFKGYYNVSTGQSTCCDYAPVLEFGVDVLYDV